MFSTLPLLACYFFFGGFHIQLRLVSCLYIPHFFTGISNPHAVTSNMHCPVTRCAQAYIQAEAGGHPWFIQP